MTRLLLGVVVLFLGCNPKPEQVHEIGIDSLVRDFQVARSFSGKLVKLAIQPGTYSLVGREVHVHGTLPGRPPIVVFQLSAAASPPGDPQRPVYLVGRCGSPVRDHVWRSSRADYYVTVADCLAAQP